MTANAEIALSWILRNFVCYLSAAALAAQKRARWHVKINTGLNRLACSPAICPMQSKRTAASTQSKSPASFRISRQPKNSTRPLPCCSSNASTKRSIMSVCSLPARGFRPVRHIAASAAAMLWRQTRLDLARSADIALHGLWPSAATREAMNGGKLPTQPALSWNETELVVVRSIDAGEPVGYYTTLPRAAPHVDRRLRAAGVRRRYRSARAFE